MTSLTELPPALAAPVPQPEERRAEGKARRSVTPRSGNGAWEPSPHRPDPVELLIEQSRSRLPDLVPVRNRRMVESPFAFLRGSALQMAHDLASTPNAGITVQLCGDAHLSNFGIFASPERRLLFDLNDFDETWPGPFEWDVKRLAASVVVAARDNGYGDAFARKATLGAVRAYRLWTDRYSRLTNLDIWYAKLDAQELLDLMSPSERRAAQRTLEHARRKDHLKALTKLTTVVDGRRRIVADPPLVVPVEDHLVVEGMPVVIEAYRATLRSDHRALFDRYRFVDIALKVVGVGSVGTRCLIGLFQGPNGGPLFLQMKEAVRSSLDLAGLPGDVDHQGHRVVHGQRMLQAASDVLLGWTTGPFGHQYYVRQLWDAKASADVPNMAPGAFATYVAACGWALARAHARTGDPVTLAGYLGRSDRFDEAVADFAVSYADQTQRDHAALVAAVERGVVPVAPAS